MYWQKRLDRKNPDQEIEAEMLKIREKHKDYGCLRMTNELRNRGFSINKKKVQRLIKKLGIKVTAYTRKSRRIQLNLNTMKWMPKALSVKRNCI